jgi:hypothetical protein
MRPARRGSDVSLFSVAQTSVCLSCLLTADQTSATEDGQTPRQSAVSPGVRPSDSLHQCVLAAKAAVCLTNGRPYVTRKGRLIL